ncbi:hypothetical protein FRB99_002854 [Tulasnella sp. 403]|nr:hypothetical protein FRB99_002854 [Tulasnella sp. 403]
MLADEDSFLFEGGNSTECDQFIRYVRMQALRSGKAHDKDWAANFAAACLGGEALRWYLTLDEQTQDDWKELQKVLVQRFSSAKPLASIVPSPAAAVPAPVPSYVARIKLATDSPNTSAYISRYHNSNGSLRPCKTAKDALWVRLATFSPFSRFRCLNAQTPSGTNDWLGVHFHDVSTMDEGNIAHANFTPMSYALDGSLRHPTSFSGPAQTAIWAVKPTQEVNINWDVDGMPYDLSTVAIHWKWLAICISVDYEAFTKHYGAKDYTKARMVLERVEI